MFCLSFWKACPPGGDSASFGISVALLTKFDTFARCGCVALIPLPQFCHRPHEPPSLPAALLGLPQSAGDLDLVARAQRTCRELKCHRSQSLVSGAPSPPTPAVGTTPAQRWGSISEKHLPILPCSPCATLISSACPGVPLKPNPNLPASVAAHPAELQLAALKRFQASLWTHTIDVCHPRPCSLSSLLGQEAVVGMVTFPVKVSALKDVFQFQQGHCSFPPL